MPDEAGGWASSGFSAFFRAHYERVLRTTYLVVSRREVAEEITQEAFLVVWRHWSRMPTIDRPDLWVSKVAIRLAVRQAKRERAVVRDPKETDLVASAAETDIDLMRQVASLPGAQRAAIVLFYLEDRSVAEVAEILECATATVRVHLHRARAKLRVLMGEGRP